MRTSSVSINPTPPASSFTPIHGRKPSSPEPSRVPSRRHLTRHGHLALHDASGENCHHPLREASLARNPNLKRSREVHEEDNVRQSRRQTYLPTTPSDTLFQTLRVTKSSSIHDSTISRSNTGDTSSCNDTFQVQRTSPSPLGWTTMEQLIPYPSRSSYESGYQLDQDTKVEAAGGPDTDTNLPSADCRLPRTTVPVSLTSLLFKQSVEPANLPPADLPIARGNAGRSDDGLTLSTSQGVDAASDPEDEYPLDDDLRDEDMSVLLDSASHNIQETCIPPSSITQAWDHDSRSAAEYDPTLQYSSPSGSSHASKQSQAVGMAKRLGANQNDLLDDDVDWNTVFALMDKIPKVVSATGSQDTQPSHSGDQVPCAKTPAQQNSFPESTIPMKPFCRPSFPDKVCDRPVAPGISSNAILRTCFRVGEMVREAVRCLTQQQEVVFELFARVTYSSRESLARRQHFQFVDLFKDQQPYPGGTLTNWRAGSQLDRQSTAFLDRGTGRKVCRCLCKPKRERRAETGFTLVILAILEADWSQIEWAKKVVCGDSDEQQARRAVGVNR
ncbi:hypothetical protein GGR52DRAFT_553357 [Hypoxylon sp. FL1284]|nr:hypothetical protein GGR52DRAFT_553357 [Hypoxylon sp. FL1284]